MNFLEHLDLHAPEDGPYRLTPGEQHANRNGTVHGGVLATLLDSAMGAAAREELGDDAEVATAALSVTYLAPGKIGEELTVRTQVLKPGKTLMMLTGEVLGPDGTAVAHAVGTFAVL